jgi:tetratricopeptide (TPR) repeat protein
MRLSRFGTVIFVTLFPLFWAYLELIPRLIALGMLAVVAILWIVQLARSDRLEFAIPKIILPLAVILGLHLISLSWSQPAIVEIPWILNDLLMILILLLVVYTARTGGWAHLWEEGLIFAGLAYTLPDLVFVINKYISWWRISGMIFAAPPAAIRIPGTVLAHHNLVAGFMSLVIPLVLLRIIRPTRVALRVFWGILVIYFLVILYFTGSRTGWLSLAAAIVIMCGLLYGPGILRELKQMRQTGASRNFSKRRSLLLVLLVCCILLSLALVLLPGRFMHGTLEQRINIWRFAWDSFRQAPLMGNGAGQVSFLFAQRSEGIGGDEVFHAHNLWLQITAGAGLVGLILVVWAIYLLLRAGLSGWSSFPSGSSQKQSLSAYAGIGAALFVESLLDFYFGFLPILLGIVIWIGLIYRLAGDRNFYRIRSRRAIILLLPLFLIFFIGAGYYLFGFQMYVKGRDAALSGDWDLAEEQLCQAASTNPQNPYYAFQCSLANAMLASKNNDHHRLEAALKIQKQALEKDPSWYLHWANLASYEWQLGQHQQAIEHLQRAIRDAPKREFLWLNLAWMEEQLGDHRAALEHYYIAYCLNPWYEQSLFFHNTQLRKQALEKDCLEFNPDWEMTLNWRLLQAYKALRAGDNARAQEIITHIMTDSPGKPDSHIYQAVLYQRSGEEQLAWREVEAATLLFPPTTNALLAAAQVAEDQGKLEQAQNIRQGVLGWIMNPKYAFYSYNFYRLAYNVPSLNKDSSPYLISAWLTPELENTLSHLMEDYLDQGDYVRAQTIQELLDKQLSH